MLDVTTFHSTADAVFAAFRNYFIVVWRTETTVPLVRAMGRNVERFAASHEGGVSMIVIVEEGCAMPDGPTRDVMATDMKRHESFTKHMALVYEGTGFRAAALRSIVAGLHVVSRQRVSTKVLSNVTQAAEWLAGSSASELVAAVERARGR